MAGVVGALSFAGHSKAILCAAYLDVRFLVARQSDGVYRCVAVYAYVVERDTTAFGQRHGVIPDLVKEFGEDSRGR